MWWPVNTIQILSVTSGKEGGKAMPKTVEGDAIYI